MFLGEYKYIVKEKKILEYITDNIEISSDSDRKDSDEENSYEKILIKKFLKKISKKTCKKKVSKKIDEEN